MNGPKPPIDPDGLVAAAGDLPDDVPNDDFTADEPPVVDGPVPDTKVDEPVEGSPLTDAEIGG
jgi:hypothetical protein